MLTSLTLFTSVVLVILAMNGFHYAGYWLILALGLFVMTVVCSYLSNEHDMLGYVMSFVFMLLDLFLILVLVLPILWFLSVLWLQFGMPIPYDLSPAYLMPNEKRLYLDLAHSIWEAQVPYYGYPGSASPDVSMSVYDFASISGYNPRDLQLIHKACLGVMHNTGASAWPPGCVSPIMDVWNLTNAQGKPSPLFMEMFNASKHAASL